jgi:hypothetical protein
MDSWNASGTMRFTKSMELNHGLAVSFVFDKSADWIQVCDSKH